MYDFRKTFFQLLLVILALAFVVGIRYITSADSAEVGSFGKRSGYTNITVAEVFEHVTRERGEKR